MAESPSVEVESSRFRVESFVIFGLVFEGGADNADLGRLLDQVVLLFSFDFQRRDLALRRDEGRLQRQRQRVVAGVEGLILAEGGNVVVHFDAEFLLLLL